MVPPKIGGMGPEGEARRVSPADAPPGIFFGDDPISSTSTPDPGDATSGNRTAESTEDRRLGLPALAGVASTVSLLPLTALALLPFWVVINLVTDVPFVLLFVAYILTGSALCFPSTQRLLLTVFFGARDPTPRELETLEPAWHNVLEAADIDRDRYVLAVTDTPQIDAIAAGGRIVAVSRLTLTLLPPDELEAALAHELGHHLGFHSVSRMAALWLEAPILLFARLGIWLELAAYALALWFAWQEDFGLAIGALLAGLGVRIADSLVPAALGAAGLVHAVRRMFGRFSTYQADQTAVDLGYGDEMVDLLERMVEYRLEGGDNTTMEHLLGGRSLVARRIERIEATPDAT
jgi:Zn-dependent protease with chaperone function